MFPDVGHPCALLSPPAPSLSVRVQVWLLEVNSYPAIASGTMRAVDTHVYTELVRDVVSLVVLPAISNTEPHAGSFLPCDL